MFGALKRGRFRSLASLILVVNVVGELQQKRTLAASRGFLAAARLSCLEILMHEAIENGLFSQPLPCLTPHEPSEFLDETYPAEARWMGCRPVRNA